MFKRIRAFFQSEPPSPKRTWVTFEKGMMKVDINGFLSSPEGKKTLQDAQDLTDRLIAEGRIVDLTKKQ